MKMLRTIILSCLTFLSLAAMAEKADRIYIFNGYFFKELPSAVGSSMPEDLKIFFINTPNGNKAVGMYAPSVELSEESLRYAVAVENVAEGEELLRRYNERKEESDVISVSMSASDQLLKVGEPFPDFTATDITGTTWTSADVKGKIMVLNVWFTGCGPCRREMPELSAWKNEMPDVMFFSSTYETPEIVRPVLEKFGFNWIPLVNNGQFKEFIGDHGYPLTVIVGRDGRIAAVEYGTSPEQRAALKSLLASLR